MRKLVSLIVLCVSLTGCVSEEASLDGRWVGTITPEERADLKIEGQRPNNEFVVVFDPTEIHLNDTVRPVEYLSNRGRTLAHLQDENRALTIFHYEEDPNKIRLSAVSYFRADVHTFVLHREPEK